MATTNKYQYNQFEKSEINPLQKSQSSSSLDFLWYIPIIGWIILAILSLFKSEEPISNLSERRISSKEPTQSSSTTRKKMRASRNSTPQKIEAPVSIISSPSSKSTVKNPPQPIQQPKTQPSQEEQRQVFKKMDEERTYITEERDAFNQSTSVPYNSRKVFLDYVGIVEDWLKRLDAFYQPKASGVLAEIQLAKSCLELLPNQEVIEGAKKINKQLNTMIGEVCSVNIIEEKLIIECSSQIEKMNEWYQSLGEIDQKAAKEILSPSLKKLASELETRQTSTKNEKKKKIQFPIINKESKTEKSIPQKESSKTFLPSDKKQIQPPAKSDQNAFTQCKKLKNKIEHCESLKELENLKIEIQNFPNRLDTAGLRSQLNQAYEAKKNSFSKK